MSIGLWPTFLDINKNNFTDWDENVIIYPIQAFEISDELLTILATFTVLFVLVFLYVSNSNKNDRKGSQYVQKKWN